MAAEVRNLNADKLFKIAKLNLRGKARDWFRKLQPALADWIELRTLILQKYGNVDADDIRMKLDAIKQEPKERVQKYFERMDKLFRRGNIPNAEQRRQILGELEHLESLVKVARKKKDAEMAATQVRRGPGTDVEILPLSVVNLIQRSGKVTDCHNSEAVHESKPESSNGIVQSSKQGAGDQREVEESESDSDSSEDVNELD
ncbi:unnamed protein product [Sphagnum tenellum]